MLNAFRFFCLEGDGGAADVLGGLPLARESFRVPQSFRVRYWITS